MFSDPRLHRFAVALIVLIGVASFALCFLAPLAAACHDLLDADWSRAVPSSRTLGLLVRGIWIAVAAAALAQLLGGVLAIGLVATRPHWLPAATGFIAAFIFLTPPYIYAYAWSLLLLPQGINVAATQATPWPPWITHEGRAVACLAMWLAPAAGLILAEGWRRSGRDAYRLALLDAGGVHALWRGAAKALSPWIIVSVLVTFLLASTEFSVCHLCQVQILNTEILADTQLATRYGQAFLTAWPLVALLAVVAALLASRSREIRTIFEALQPTNALAATGESVTIGRAWVAPSVLCAVLMLPWLILVAYLREPHGFISVWKSYPDEWPDAVGCAAASAIVSIAVALSITWSAESRHPAIRTIGHVALLITVGAGLCPPALVGDAIKAAFAGVWIIESHWFIVSIATTTRFAIVATSILVVAMRSTNRDAGENAELDGASASTRRMSVELPLSRGPLVASLLCVFVLSLTEIPASVLVRPAGVGSVAVTLLNQIHFGRNSEIVSMCLYLGFAIAAVIVAQRLLLRPRDA